MTKGLKEHELYRDKLVDWMISHDIPTGGAAQTFDELLQVLHTHIVHVNEELAALRLAQDHN